MLSFKLSWTAVELVENGLYFFPNCAKSYQKCQIILSKCYLINIQMFINDVILYIADDCQRFLCQGEPCDKENSHACKTTKLKVCIDKSLHCNDVPNCGYSDNSDEKNCKYTSLDILFCTLPNKITISFWNQNKCQCLLTLTFVRLDYLM